MARPQVASSEERVGSDELAPLLNSSPTQSSTNDGVPPRITRRLYVSHFLSAWNSRAFEFGAVLYLAKIFPGTLMPMSVYALTRGLSVILLASAIGQYIDTGHRLNVVRVSIVFQRLVVAASCGLFYLMKTKLLSGRSVDVGLLVLTSFFACIEKLCSIMNQVSVEKDWVVVVADNHTSSLRKMNAQMRRIDLLCKLLGPLSIALIDGISTETAIIFNFTMNVCSVVIGYHAIARVYYEVPALQANKCDGHSPGMTARGLPGASIGRLNGLGQRLKFIAKKSADNMRLYVRHRAFLSSFASALLYLTVLSFGGQMVTYLLSTGYSATGIGIARTLSVAFEVLATWVAPWLMELIGPVRAGLWMSSWQVSMLAVGTAIFWAYQDQPWLSATDLVGGTTLSRVGLRGFDLCTQIIVQEDVEAENRGAFSSVEAAWQNAFELLSYASAIAFFRPEQFRWPSLLSVAAVATASAAYTFLVYLRRGHLLHLKALGKLSCIPVRSRQSDEERVIARITSKTDI